MPEQDVPQVSPRPVLTLAIPTYNRAANLELLLRTLAPQLAAEPAVELLISDNASPDATEALVRGLIAAGLRCRYLRNQENIEADPNFLQCYHEARGKYVWIFGDDDLLLPGALSFLMRFLVSSADRPEFDLIFITPFGFVHQPDERRLARPDPPAFAFTDPIAFLRAVGLRGDLALISAVLLNKDTVERHPHPDFAEGKATNLLQLGWTFSALRYLRHGLVLDRGLLAICELNPQRPFDVARVFGVHWAQAAARHFGQGTKLYRAVLRDQLYSWFVTNWYGMRRNAEHTILRDPVGQMRPYFGRLPLFWFSTWPILAWPMPLAGAWLLLWRTLRRFDLWMHRRSAPTLTAPLPSQGSESV